MVDFSKIDDVTPEYYDEPMSEDDIEQMATDFETEISDLEAIIYRVAVGMELTPSMMDKRARVVEEFDA